MLYPGCEAMISLSGGMEKTGQEEVSVMRANPGRMKVLKGRVISVLAPLLFTATLASADAGATGGGGMSPLTMIFLGILAAIILLQLIPALVLFSSLVVAVFKRSSKKAAATSSDQA